VFWFSLLGTLLFLQHTQGKSVAVKLRSFGTRSRAVVLAGHFRSLRGGCARIYLRGAGRTDSRRIPRIFTLFEGEVYSRPKYILVTRHTASSPCYVGLT